MNAKKILVATDFSPASTKAIAIATSLAKGANAELILSHVVPTPPAWGTEGMMMNLEDLDLRLAQQKLNEVKVPDLSVRVRREARMGMAAEELVALAEEEKVDLIVIGTHGRTGLSRLVMGSVAEAVVRHAKCPVLSVKPETEVAVAELVAAGA